jgi:hypothetical protein
MTNGRADPNQPLACPKRSDRISPEADLTAHAPNSLAPRKENSSTRRSERLG